MTDQSFNNRITELERHAAATSSDIRGIYAGLDEIRDVLVRIQEGNKPNIGGMVLGLIATVSLVITIGSLSLSPIKATNIRQDTTLQRLVDLELNDIERLGSLEARVDYNDTNSSERHEFQAQRMTRMQDQLDLLKEHFITTQKDVAYMQGTLYEPHKGDQ